MKRINYLAPLFNLRKFRIYKFLLSLFIIFSCSHLEDQQPSNINQSNALNNASTNTIPINFGKYSLLNKNLTRSCNNNDSINIEHLIEWNNAKQISSDRSVYTQVPFKSNDSISYASISNKLDFEKDSIVSFKTYYIKYENIYDNINEEYIVAMVPSKSFYNTNKDYDYLYKPNYSGIIIYANIQGEYLFNEVCYKGMVLDGILVDEDFTSNNEYIKKEYISFYKNNTFETKSNDEDIWQLELDECVVTASYTENGIAPYFEDRDLPSIRDELQREIDYVEKPFTGGGIRNDSTALKYKVSVNIKYENNCFYKGIGSFTKGSSVIVSTPHLLTQDTTAKFHAWTDESDKILSYSKSIQIVVNSIRTLNAYYYKDDSLCAELAELLKDNTSDTTFVELNCF